MNPRPVLALAATAIVALLAGCGSSSGGSSDPASLAPPTSPLYVEAKVRPTGELKANIEAVAKSVAGIDDVGGLIVSKLESSASDSGEEFDYEKEVEPWLGEKAGISFQHYDGNDFKGYAIAVQTTDSGASEEFVDQQAEQDNEKVEDASFEGIDFKVQADGTAIGVVGDFLVIGEDEGAFKAAVEASEGESLADEDNFSSTFSNASEGSFADVFVDIGGLIEQSGGSVDPQALGVLEGAGIDPTEATAVASLVPGSDNVEIDVSADLGGETPPSGNASKLLEAMPGDAFAAFVSPEVGKALEEGIDSLDESGIPGDVPPNKLKSTLKEAGLDLDKIAGSLEDAAVFAEGHSEGSLGGALVLTTKGSGEATNAVSNIGLFLRAAHVPGVTAVNGKFSGFSIHSAELGSKPLVVATAGDRIAIAYGLPAATKALSTESSETLADNPMYTAAVGALGSTPISGFVDGHAALKLASALVPSTEEGFREAKRYLTKIDYVAIGSGSSGDLATAKLIVGVGR